MLEVRPYRRGVLVSVDSSGELRRIAGTHLLVAAGRRPNIAGLGLDQAGVRHSRSGITVDAQQRTTNSNIFAIGAAAGHPSCTHLAVHQADVVVRTALLGHSVSVNTRCVPQVIYTQPEIAKVQFRRPPGGPRSSG